MNTTANTIVSIHTNLAELIGVFGGWTVDVANDDAGIYISMTNPEDEADHRGLSLASSEESDDLNQFHWQFWNEAEGVWFDSTLGVDASSEEVLGFLKDCLSEESLPIGAME
jgi:hypothetical protein